MKAVSKPHFHRGSPLDSVLWGREREASHLATGADDGPNGHYSEIKSHSLRHFPALIEKLH